MSKKQTTNIVLERNADGSLGVKTEKLVVIDTKNSSIQIGDKIIGGFLPTDPQGESPFWVGEFLTLKHITTDKEFKSFLKQVADLPQIMLQVERIVINIAFMDNAEGHYSQCLLSSRLDHINIDCIKVNECSSSSRTKCHHDCISMINEQESDINVILCTNAIAAVCKLYDYEDYFDNTSGILPEVIESHIGKTLVFDWDRTLTMTEGFIGRPTIQNFDQYAGVWSSFVKKAGFNDGNFDEYFTKENVLKAMCGGTKRFDHLSSIIPKNSFVITANKMKGLVSDFASLLIGPINTQQRVFSIHEFPVGTSKHDIILSNVVPLIKQEL